MKGDLDPRLLFALGVDPDRGSPESRTESFLVAVEREVPLLGARTAASDRALLSLARAAQETTLSLGSPPWWEAAAIILRQDGIPEDDLIQLGERVPEVDLSDSPHLQWPNPDPRARALNAQAALIEALSAAGYIKLYEGGRPRGAPPGFVKRQTLIDAGLLAAPRDRTSAVELLGEAPSVDPDPRLLYAHGIESGASGFRFLPRDVAVCRLITAVERLVLDRPGTRAARRALLALADHGQRNLLALGARAWWDQSVLAWDRTPGERGDAEALGTSVDGRDVPTPWGSIDPRDDPIRAAYWVGFVSPLVEAGYVRLMI